MDFSTRSSQQSPAAPRPGTSFGEAPAPRKDDKLSNLKRRPKGKWMKWGGLALLTALALLVLAVLALSIFSGGKSESKLIDKDNLQAVFLTNDQVYFGKITSLNSQYIALSNIYYLQTQSSGTDAQATAGNNVSLVKLGCELHKPYDKMVINRDEVQFWENLQADGQVADAVKKFVEQNPQGQKCSTTTGASSTNVQGSANTTPATNTPATNTDNAN